MTIEDPLLSAHSYQLLSIATSFLVSNNREIDVSDIFKVFYSLLVEGHLKICLKHQIPCYYPLNNWLLWATIGVHGHSVMDLQLS